MFAPQRLILAMNLCPEGAELQQAEKADWRVLIRGSRQQGTPYAWESPFEETSPVIRRPRPIDVESSEGDQGHDVAGLEISAQRILSGKLKI